MLRGRPLDRYLGTWAGSCPGVISPAGVLFVPCSKPPVLRLVAVALPLIDKKCLQTIIKHPFPTFLRSNVFPMGRADIV